jgi:TRAP-type C4-dicarboxylate transport system substrate-binding protein
MRFSVLIAVFMCLTLVVPPSADATQLKIATVAPDGSYWMTEARKAADEISERTGGRVTFRFYPGGTMGDDDAVLRKMRIGQLHGGVFLAGTFAHVVPDFQVYNLPLLFKSYDEVDAVRSEIDSELVDALDSSEYKTFGFIEGGFAYIYSTKEISDFHDLQGLKAWLPENDPIGKVLIEETSLSPVPLSLADVLTGLQTGLIDVVTGPPVAAVALQWFTKVKYAIEFPVVYTFGLMAISDRAWSSLSAADQEVVGEVFGRMTRALDRRAREDNLGAREALEKQGVVTLTPPAETEREWQNLAKRASQRLVADLGLSRELVARVEAIIASVESRSTAAPAAGS